MINNRWWLTTLIGIVLLSAVQIAAVQKTKRQTEELRTLLSDTQSQSLQLMQELGYGGLIHNFKNFILRSGVQVYKDKAVSSAASALHLVNSLERKAAELSVATQLQSTRQMISGYESRLHTVAQMHSAGALAVDIDKAVRFDDASAILEIQTLVTNLSKAVDDKVQQLDKRGIIFSTATIIGTVILSGLTLALMLNQRQRRKHLSVVESMNNELETGNHELLQANTSLKQFAGIVSHDLKSPLRHISIFNDMILEDYDNKEDVQEHVGRIRKASKSMDQMIASLLEFTLAGFAEPDLSSIDISKFVTDVVDELRPTAEGASAQINTQVEGYVSADRELLGRALHNLIGNSIKYRRSDVIPHIQITTKRINNNIHFAIIDNGIGIEPQYAERIFLPFQRLHNSQSHFEGNGIGLSLVKSIIESHGGKVWLDKDHVGGTRFEFTLTAA